MQYGEHVNEMDALRVRVDKVLVLLRANRAQHREVFEEAIENYRIEALRQLEQRVEEIREGRDFDLGFVLPTPEDHTSDYDRAITMLELTKEAGEEFVIMDRPQQQNYIMDDWGWKDAWIMNTMSYTQQ